MNAARRKAIDALIARVRELQTTAEALVADIEEVRDEEQEYLDNMPESLQDSDKGQAASAAIDALETAAELLGEVGEDAISSMEEAQA